MSPKGKGKIRKAPPHLTVNSGYEDSFGEQSNVTPPQSSSMASRPLITAPQPPYSPTPRVGDSTPVSPFSQHGQESTELLSIPPSRFRGYTDNPHMNRSTDFSNLSSRRTSWSSDNASRRELPYVVGSGQFTDSRAPSRAGSDDEAINTQTVAEKFAIEPDGCLIVYPHDVEQDDDLHNPDVDDLKDRDCNIWTRRGAINIGGLALFVLGLLFLLVAYPLMYVLRSPTLPPSLKKRLTRGFRF